MDKTLEYVRQFVAEPRIFSSLRTDDPVMVELPEWWRKVLLANHRDRIQQTLEAWEGQRTQLPLVFEFLAARLRSVNLLMNKNYVTGKMDVRLLYEMDQDGEPIYYTGGNPSEKTMAKSVTDTWDKLPVDFRRFYDSLHNGWYDLASNSLGPSATEDFFILDDLEWGILDEIGEPGCDLKDLLAVYTNGMGGYVALSIERKGAYGDVLWWKDKPPRLNIDAWGVIDAWTEIGLNK